MSAGTLYPYSVAHNVATQLIGELASSCERIEIAGSLRRKRSQVHDIDIVAIAKVEQVPDDTMLFGEPMNKNLLDEKLAELCFSGQLIPVTHGSKVRRFVVDTPQLRKLQIDIYLADASTWTTILLIRTGSKEHNIRLAQRAIQKRMQLKADGSGIISAGGSTLAIESEADLFRHLDLPYLPPEERN